MNDLGPTHAYIRWLILFWSFWVTPQEPAEVQAQSNSPVTVGANQVLNFSAENADPSNPNLAANWTPQGNGYARALSTPAWNGSYAIRLTGSPNNISVAMQEIVLNQTTAMPVTITARVRGENIQNLAGDRYGAVLQCTVERQTGEVDFCPTTEKTKHTGTFGWRLVGISTDHLTRAYKPIKKLRLLATLGPTTGTAWFDGFQVKPYNPGTFRGAVTLFPDDGYKEHYTVMRPQIASYGWKATAAIVTDYPSSGDPGYMNWQEVDALAESGWEIASHTTNHSDLTKLSVAEMEDQLYWSKKRLTDRGFAVKILATPFGAYNAPVLGLSSERGYYSSIRNTDGGINPSDPGGYNPVGVFPLNVRVQKMETTTTLAQVNTWLNEAINKKVWVVILIHKIRDSCGGDRYCVSPNLFGSTLAAIHSKALPVVTYEEGLNMVKSPR